MAVDVAVERAGAKLFTYAAPAGTAPGTVVRVPFRNGERLGIAVAEVEAPAGLALKPVRACLGVLPPDVLALLHWFHDDLLADWGTAAWALLPPDRKGAREAVYALAAPPARVRGRRQAAILAALAKGPRPASALPASPAALRELERRGWIRTVTLPPTVPRPGDVALTAEQEAAVAAARAPGVHLLFGPTGSGKTEVYLELARQALLAGRGAIVALPEIALTAQMVELFRSRFGTAMVVVHSRLAGGERAEAYFRLLRGEARLALGARSAVLAPVRDLGLVVLDEEHEPSYQQDEAPRYHARRAAEVRARRAGASLVLGSATPDATTFARATRGDIGLLRLSRRFGAGWPPVEVVDLRRRTDLLSPRLIEALSRTRAEGAQAILFLNRRGYGRSLVCADCGQGFPCPHCSVALVFHLPERRLRCHYCGHAERPPDRCPACRGTRLRPVGTGTERLVEELQRRLGGLRVLRLDQDAVRRQGSHAAILGAFGRGEADVLVGTQMVAKGLHFPNVALSAVVLADATLAFPDYRAAERTFQLVTQVAGRSGRGERPGHVIVQTYTPGHYALRHASRHDAEGFLAEELAARRRAHYPPYCHLLLFGFSGPERLAVAEAAERKARRLRELGEAPLGPSPALVERVKDRYRWQVLVKLPSWEAMTAVARAATVPLPAGVREAVILDPMSTL